MKLIILFAPKFKEFGVDIAKELISSSRISAVGGVCTGGMSVVSYVEENLKDNLLFADNVESLEKKWLALPNDQIDLKYLEGIDNKYGYGTVGKVVTSDRRVGLGLVRGGLTRPDEIGDVAIQFPVETTQKYIQGLFQYLEKCFDEHQPDGVFCYAVAGGPATAMALICKARGVKFFRFNVTRINDGFVIDTDYKGRLAPIAEKFRSNAVLNKESIEKATDFLDAYRGKPVSPGYMAYNYSILKKNNIIPLTKSLFKFITKFILKPLLSTKYKTQLNKIELKRIVFALRSEWKKVMFDPSVFESKMPDEKYLYYPLHVDPEASTMVMSPMHTDQISIIESIAKSLPGDMTLVVKEHLPMIGRRTRFFYEHIKSLPRVRLVSPSLNSHDLIRSSEGVVVITGTAAFEAVLLGKKAIVIGDSPYLAMETGMIHEPNLSNLHQAIAALENLGAPDVEKLIRYIAIAQDESFEMKSSVLWGDYTAVNKAEKERLLLNIVEKINSCFLK